MQWSILHERNFAFLLHRCSFFSTWNHCGLDCPNTDVIVYGKMSTRFYLVFVATWRGKTLSSNTLSTQLSNLLSNNICVLKSVPCEQRSFLSPLVLCGGMRDLCSQGIKSGNSLRDFSTVQNEIDQSENRHIYRCKTSVESTHPGGDSHTWPDGDARRNFSGVETVDPVTFRVSGWKN